MPVPTSAVVRRLLRDPSHRRVVVAVLLKFVLLAGLWWVFVRDVTWTPTADDVGNAFLSPAPRAGLRSEEAAP